MNPLNPSLYNALKRVFHHVQVTSQGDPGRVDYWPNWQRGGKLEAHVSNGEYYRVSCPFCSDTRKRLWFNYRWGTRDERTGWIMLHLVNCFNEPCVDSRSKQNELRDMLDVGRLPCDTPLRSSASIRTERPAKIELPEGIVPITDRRLASDARVDLAERGFDIKELWDRWRVFYCEESDSPLPKIRWRIVIPVYGFRRRISPNGKFKIALEGWQARAIEPIREGEMKYLTARGMRKTEALYGATAAVDTDGPVVICEGPTDVWRLRSNAVALFGKKLSDHQRNIIVHRFEHRPVVVFLDRDAQSEARDIVRRIRSERSQIGDDTPVFMARLPGKRDDVGECTWEEAWNQVAKAMGRRLKELPIDPDELPPVRHPKKTAWRHQDKRRRPSRS